MGEQLAQARVPPTIHASIRQGRMIALQKPRSGVRGILVGDVVRRLVARTMAQQLSKAVEAATARHQYAMCTRAGTECVAHVLQVLTEIGPQTTIVSIDGVGAYDSISRKAMLEALIAMPGGSEALPFVRSFYGQPSSYVWEDEFGEIHHIDQGEGGAALEAVRARLLPEERLFAFLDDVYVVTTPSRVGFVHNILQEELYRHARIRIHAGKTQVWNAAGDRPPACDLLERIAQASDPKARVWKGSGVPTEEQGVRILGTPLGHLHYVQAFLRRVMAEHEVLLSRIPSVQDVQSAWALLLRCAGGRANYMLRAVRPETVRGFAEGHNAGLWTCLCNILNVVVDGDRQDVATMLLSLGGLGLRDAVRTSPPAFWASWADCIAMARARHPEVAALIFRAMRDPTGPATLVSVQAVAHQLVGVEGFEPPSWEVLANGQRFLRGEPEEFEPGGCRHGWQHEAASRVERQHRGRLIPRLPQHEIAMLRSQSGPLAGVPLSTTPCNFLNRIDSHLFRVLLLRRLHLPLPSLHVSAGVAVPLTLFATTAPHVLEQGCWEDGALRWKVLGRASAGKQEAES